MNNIVFEDCPLITLSQACRLLPSRPSPATIWRWRTKGVRVGDLVIRLECVRVGRKWYTTESAFREFLRRQTIASVLDNDDEQENDSDSTIQDRLDIRLRKAGLVN